MQTLICIALLFAQAHAGNRADVTPVQKVIQMLDGMLVKGKAEKHDEQVAFAKFQAWCDDARTETTKSIELGAAKIEQLEADIDKAEAEAAQLSAEISGLQASLAQMETEAATATAIRDKELAEYQAMHADFSESIDALERAIQVLKAREADVPQSLLQVQKSALIPAKVKNVIASFLATNQEGTIGAPEANAYEFQSGGVVAMLEKLRLKFQDQRKVLEQEELNNKSNYEMLMQKLTDDIKFNKEETAKKTALKGQRLQDAATAKGDLELTQKAKAEDEKTLEETIAACQARSQAYEENQVVRSGEIKAIEQAVEILSSEAVTGNADTYLPTFVQIRASALAQLRGEPAGTEDARQKAIAFLQDRAKKTGSQYLAVVAEHMESDPFVKVKKMIKDLIVKLMEQANTEADGKAYCDTELGTNKMTREDKQAEVEELTAHIEQKTAESAQLSALIAQLADQIAAIQASQAAATKQRGEEKATNAKTVADSKVAQDAVEKATAILKDFYGSVAGSSALLQDSANLKQAMSKAAKAPYTGMQASKGGIVGMLEVILSDFARLEAETLHAEDSAQAAYDKYMAETNQDVAVKETEKTHNEDRRTQTDNLIASLKKELDLTQGELDAALAYFEKLKPQCVDLGLSYEERVKARDEELQSLKEALAILQQQDLA